MTNSRIIQLSIAMLAGVLASCAHTTTGCSSATVIATGSDIDVPADRTPTPYSLGGEHPPHLPRGLKLPKWFEPAGMIAGVELSDGHAYAPAHIESADPYGFRTPAPAFASGQSVNVCVVHSQLSGRLYYRIDNKPVNREY